MNTSARETLKQRRQDAKQKGRRCDEAGCGMPVDPFKSYCSRHAKAKNRLGHPSVKRALKWKDIPTAYELARDYLSRTPAPAEVFQTLEKEILSPTASLSISKTEDWRSPKALADAKGYLCKELEWWNNPASAKRFTLEGKKWGYSLESVLAALLAVTLYTTEHEWGNGAAPEMARAIILLRMKKRPALNSLIPGNVRRLLGQLIAEKLGLYLFTTAQAIIAQKMEKAATNPPIGADKPDFTDRKVWIEVRTPEVQIIDGNGQDFEVLTGTVLVSYRKRRPEDGDAEFVVESAKTRSILSAQLTSESFTQYVSNVLNHTQAAVGGRIWVGQGSRPDPSERRASHPSPTDHGERQHPLYKGEGKGWI